jgi:hypothetical protein
LNAYAVEPLLYPHGKPEKVTTTAVKNNIITMKTPSYKNRSATLYELPTFYKSSLLDEAKGHQEEKTEVEMVTTERAPGAEPVTKCGGDGSLFASNDR